MEIKLKSKDKLDNNNCIQEIEIVEVKDEN